MSETETRAPYPQATQLLVGATSPLWGFFAGAAAGGLAFWWATQWAHPTNLEALLGKRLLDMGPEPIPEETAVALAAMAPVLAAVEAVEKPAMEFVAEAEAAAAALVENASEMALEPLPELEIATPPVVEAAPLHPVPDVAIEAPAETAPVAPREEPIAAPVAEAGPVEAPKPRRKGAVSTEPPVEPPAE